MEALLLLLQVLSTVIENVDLTVTQMIVKLEQGIGVEAEEEAGVVGEVLASTGIMNYAVNITVFNVIVMLTNINGVGVDLVEVLIIKKIVINMVLTIVLILLILHVTLVAVIQVVQLIVLSATIMQHPVLILSLTVTTLVLEATVKNVNSHTILDFSI